MLSFGPYRVDPERRQLWRGTQEVKLTPKALAVLRVFIARPGQVVTKEEIFQAVWAGTAVSDAALTSCIQELRQVLRDNPRQPRYLETVHRRGYRFIAPLTAAPPVSGSRFQVSGQQSVGSRQLSALSDQQLETRNVKLETRLVGRVVELQQLHGWLERALSGERQIVFVTGEPGIGKTTVVEAFLHQVAAEGSVWIGRGQCIEHYGAGEAYLPLLEALGRLCQEPGSEQLLTLLKQYAPTWLVQMPALFSATDLEALQRKTAGATRERMLRELAEALEVVTTERPLVLRLEDLHWSDMSTLDWLAFVARRQERARLLVIGTYRPVEVLVREHPLKAVKQELHLHGQCQELPLDFLREEDVAEYLMRRFAVGAHGRAPLQQVARLIHQRTDGNPLFMVNVVDALITQGVITSIDGQWELRDGVEQVVVGIPENLQQMIEQQLAQVNPTARLILEVASVAGAEFSAALVAAGVETTVEAVEVQCAELARRAQFLRASGTAEWPDGTIAARYGFLHALYQEVLYERLPAGQRAQLHQRIGEREEAAYDERAREIAAELAMHFERGRDYRKAVQYLQQAGQRAIERSAHVEAISHLTKGLELLKTLPDTPERIQQELDLQNTLRVALMVTRGYAAPEVGEACARVLELSRQVGETPQLSRVLGAPWAFYLIRAELQKARELGEQLLTLAQRGQDPLQLLMAHGAMGIPSFYLGELGPARTHFEQAIALYDPEKHSSPRNLQDPGAAYLAYEAMALWLLGHPDQSLKRSHEAVSLGQKLSRPYDLVEPLVRAAVVHQFRREGQAAQARAEAGIALSSEQGFPFWLSWGTILRGWALAAQGQGKEGIAQIHQGLAAYRATRAELARPYHLALLAAAYGKRGQTEEGLSVLAEALAVVDKTGERMHEAELYRMKGELSLQSEVRSPKSKVQSQEEKQKANGKGQK